MEKYAKEKGFRLTLVTPDDPNCNGFVENSMKLMCKLLHTVASESKDPKTELYNYLLHIVPQDVLQQRCFSAVNIRQNYPKFLLSRNVMI